MPRFEHKSKHTCNQEVFEEGFKKIAEKISEILPKKNKRSAAFREARSKYMRNYHSRKQELEKKVKEMESEIEELKRARAVPILSEPVQKKQYLGFSDAYERPNSDYFDFDVQGKSKFTLSFP